MLERHSSQVVWSCRSSIQQQQQYDISMMSIYIVYKHVPTVIDLRTIRGLVVIRKEIYKKRDFDDALNIPPHLISDFRFATYQTRGDLSTLK